ncbi:hypothetical protein BU17DRAFT_64092 [Hysterangium stoloniferum]|nr:hypothetical protein BU17DRAFT_64092 [Hysterangium stoloniferum]
MTSKFNQIAKWARSSEVSPSNYSGITKIQHPKTKPIQMKQPALVVIGGPSPANLVDDCAFTVSACINVDDSRATTILGVGGGTVTGVTAAIGFEMLFIKGILTSSSSYPPNTSPPLLLFHRHGFLHNISSFSLSSPFSWSVARARINSDVDSNEGGAGIWGEDMLVSVLMMGMGTSMSTSMGGAVQGYTNTLPEQEWVQRDRKWPLSALPKANENYHRPNTQTMVNPYSPHSQINTCVHQLHLVRHEGRFEL